MTSSRDPITLSEQAIASQALPSRWHQLLHRGIVRLYFDRVTLLNPDALPRDGAALYLGLHRNGAVDGLAYRAVIPRAVFMISAQLRRSRFGRLAFDGIEVVRDKDAGDRSANTAALAECLRLLEDGGALFVFPEGTSTLGPRHLPFKGGAARILLDYLSRAPGTSLPVIPLGIHYERAWAFRSRVEIVAGTPIRTDLPDGIAAEDAVAELRRRIEAGLESVGINAGSEEDLERIEQLAYLATLGTPSSYYRILKGLERGIPPEIMTAWSELESQLAGRRVLRHQGVPLFPIGPLGAYVALWIVLAPLVGAAMIANAPPLLAGWMAGEKLPDGRNVISLWRLLVGAPVLAAWALLIAIALLVSGHPWSIAWYTVLTALGLTWYYRAKKLTVAVANALLCPDLRAPALRFHRLVIDQLAPPTPAPTRGRWR